MKLHVGSRANGAGRSLDGSSEPPPSFNRAEALRRLSGAEFDVVVIGGGITGAGIALDAASRGLRTALVEKGDFASGTSSKSSKMVHGGLRYLQQKEFRLVYENLAERQRLLDNAPHLVSPLPFLIPLFGKNGAVSKTVARSYAIALWLYDLTGGVRIGKRHRRVSKTEALEHLPKLDTSHLVAGFLYFDARADDARLTLTLIRTAVLDFGAVAANYVAAEGFLTDDQGRVTGIRARPVPTIPGTPPGPSNGADAHDGQGHGDDQATETFELHAKVVINASGVWADAVGDLGFTTAGQTASGGTDTAANSHQHPHTLKPAKGVHITVPAERLPADIAAVIPVRADRRSIFVVPWPEVDLVYLGTTDTAYDGPLDDPVCAPEDVDYILDAANAITTAKLTRKDVTGVWAGLRPLLAPNASGRKLSERTADLSRRHTVRTSDEGVVTVTGGKLTTYRKMAEDTVDQAIELMSRSGGGKGSGATVGRAKCVTHHLPLRGAPRENAPAPASAEGVERSVLAHLIARYGTEVDAVLAVAEGRSELLEPVIEGLPYLGAELVYAVRAEMAQNLDDVLARRTRAQIQRARPSAEAAGAVAGLLGRELGWTDGQMAAEATQFSRHTLNELDTAGLSEPDAETIGVRS